jgi:hypothetical protein
MKDNATMPAPRRRRKDQEPQSEVVGTPATVPIATGEIPNPVESLAATPTHDEIARRAYQLFEEHGREHGRDLEDWLQAEHDLRQRMVRDVVEWAMATGGPHAAA